jgi:hypothetical protein
MKWNFLGVSTPISSMGNRNVFPFFLISSHFYPVILDSFPNKLSYYYYLPKQKYEWKNFNI